jgi:asparagine synthase (glutamine-hydrolysing)
MLSATGRYVMVFNGEIYNYPDIRSELERSGQAPQWRGHSDSEVMLAAFEQWGVLKAIQKFNGMFAFALWDRLERVLMLGRDRMGEKPLYYGWVGNSFIFGSELKALRRHPKWQNDIDRGALRLFARHAYVPSPHSIFKGISKLLPATLLSLSWNDRRSGATPTLTPYWSARSAAAAGRLNPISSDDSSTVGELEELLRDAVGIRMQADVPLGAFLSGGIDSSLIVALMQAQSARPVRTFSIGFAESSYDEAQHAMAVAKHLGTDHTELYVTPEQALAVIPMLPQHYDEPFADSSQIPTLLVSQLARQHVTVSLSGDGGDELFGGYNRYFWGDRLWKMVGWIPLAVRVRLAGGLRQLSPGQWDSVARSVSPIFPGSGRLRRAGDNAWKLAGILALETRQDIYRTLVSHWQAPAELVKSGTDLETALTASETSEAASDFISQMMLLDQITYLPDDILVKLDRASMAVSLEGRVPFLDHRVVELAWRIPLPQKIRQGKGKWILRQLLSKYVPPSLFERPKMGFGVPIDSWLRGPLRDWAEWLLEPQRLREEGFFDVAIVRRYWDEHVSGERSHQYHLWDILMFQAWLGANT